MKIKFREEDYKSLLENLTNELSVVTDYYLESVRANKDSAPSFYANYADVHAKTIESIMDVANRTPYKKLLQRLYKKIHFKIKYEEVELAIFDKDIILQNATSCKNNLGKSSGNNNPHPLSFKYYHEYK